MFSRLASGRNPSLKHDFRPGSTIAYHTVSCSMVQLPSGPKTVGFPGGAPPDHPGAATSPELGSVATSNDFVLGLLVTPRRTYKNIPYVTK